MSTYLNKAQAEKVVEILHRNGLGCHPCTFTRDAMDAAAAVLRKEVRASEKLEQLERELAEARAELKRKDEALAEIIGLSAYLLPIYNSVGTTQLAVVRHGYAIRDIKASAAAALAQGGKEGA